MIFLPTIREALESKQPYDIIKDMLNISKVFVEIQKQFIILGIKSKRNAQGRGEVECRRNFRIVS